MNDEVIDAYIGSNVLTSHGLRCEAASASMAMIFDKKERYRGGESWGGEDIRAEEMDEQSSKQDG